MFEPMRLVRWIFGLFLIGGVCVWAQETSNIPIRTLPEVGYGPALLIGVKDYDARGSVFDPLPGIEKDLGAIEGTVRKLGWTDVTVLRDPSLDRLRAAVDEFGPKARASEGASFFYYSGHGVLQDRLNYMIPAKAQVRTRGHLSLYALPVEDLLAYLGGEGSGPALVFVDACRNNTLPAEGKNARTDLLLSRRAGMFIGFATAEGTISNASDRGSLYTRSLAQRLLTPGMSLDDLYAGIIADVERATKDRASEIQPPEKQSALRFVLHMLPGGESPEVARMRAELDRLKNRLPEPVISVSARESARDLAELFENGPFAASSQTAQRGILRDIQAKLRESGDYDASIDGIPGPSTLRAVMGFQERNGMEITGRLDADTLKGLGITTLSKQLDGRPAGLELPEMGGKPSRGGAGAGGSEGSGIELTVPAPPQIKKSPGATILDAVDATIPAPPQIKNSPGAIIP